MAERKQRRDAARVVAAVAQQQALAVLENPIHGRGVEHRAVGLGRRQRHGQPSARLGIAEQGIGTGMPELTTTMVLRFTAATRLTSSSWRLGKARVGRSNPSLSVISADP